MLIALSSLLTYDALALLQTVKQLIFEKVILSHILYGILLDYLLCSGFVLSCY